MRWRPSRICSQPGRTRRSDPCPRSSIGAATGFTSIRKKGTRASRCTSTRAKHFSIQSLLKPSWFSSVEPVRRKSSIVNGRRRRQCFASLVHERVCYPLDCSYSYNQLKKNAKIFFIRNLPTESPSPAYSTDIIEKSARNFDRHLSGTIGSIVGTVRTTRVVVQIRLLQR